MKNVIINTYSGRELKGELIKTKDFNGELIGFVELNKEAKTGAWFSMDRVKEAPKPVKVSGSIEFSKYTSEDKFTGEQDDRALCVNIEIKGVYDYETLNNIYNNVIEYMEGNLDISFHRCPWWEELENRNILGDGFHVDFELGEMADIRKEIKEVWKEAKRLYSIR